MDVTTKILNIINCFGMKQEKAAQAMSITYGTFRNKKNPNNNSDSFNEKNLQDLKNFIILKAKEL